MGAAIMCQKIRLGSLKLVRHSVQGKRFRLQGVLKWWMTWVTPQYSSHGHHCCDMLFEVWTEAEETSLTLLCEEWSKAEKTGELGTCHTV